MSDMRAKLIAIVWSHYDGSSNPWDTDLWHDGLNKGKEIVCDDILDILGMTYDEVKTYKASETRKGF